MECWKSSSLAKISQKWQIVNCGAFLPLMYASFLENAAEQSYHILKFKLWLGGLEVECYLRYSFYEFFFIRSLCFWKPLSIHETIRKPQRTPPIFIQQNNKTELSFEAETLFPAGKTAEVSDFASEHWHALKVSVRI